MNARVVALALAVSCAGGVTSAGGRAWAAEASPLAAAQRAVRELRYEDARGEVDAALRRGHHPRKELIALYALRAEVTSIVDGASAGEGEFRRLLVLAPDHTLPRDTPIFSVPFTRAQRWVASHGHLEVEHKIGAAPRLGVATPLAVAVTSDPLAAVAGARLWVRMPDEHAFVALPGTSLRPSLPPIPAGGGADYYIEAVDAGDNVVAELGTADEPFTLVGPAARPSAAPLSARVPERVAAEANAQAGVASPALVAAAPARARHGYRIAGGVLAGLGLGALGAGIAIDVDGRHQLDALQTSCAPACSQSQVDSLKLSEGVAIGLYAAAGAVLTTSVILFTVDLARSRRH
ncbi:MAG: hypothetical protein JWN44_5489 [Myxococcales bacterium]|nr:hypothetical protein [Myxococcales bacterium]